MKEMQKQARANREERRMQVHRKIITKYYMTEYKQRSTHDVNLMTTCAVTGLLLMSLGKAIQFMTIY